MKSKKLHLMIVLVSSIFFISSCTREVPPKDLDTVIIGHKTDHATLNPLLSKRGVTNQIIQNMFYSLSPLDPYTMNMVPVIAESPPKRIKSDDANSNVQKFEIWIREEAKWHDGKPILASDVLSTAKITFVPNVDAGIGRSVGSELSDIIVYPDEPRKLTFIYERAYLNDSINVATFTPLPKHIYDPEGILNDISYREIKNTEDPEQLFEKYPELRAFGESFNSAKYSRETIVGSGPYKLKEWKSGSRQSDDAA